MIQSIEITQATTIEAYGKDYTILKIDDLTLEMDNDIADEIMEKICKRLKGFYIEDKILELEHKIDELKKDNENLQELLEEAVLRV